MIRSSSLTNLLNMLTALVVMSAVSPAFAQAKPEQKPWYAGTFAAGRQTCHAANFGDADRAAHPQRRVTAISLERATRDLDIERRLGELEQFDGTPLVSATLRVRLQGDPVSHAVRLECAPEDDGTLICTNPGCAGGEIRLRGEGKSSVMLSIGGTLKSGKFVSHYVHLDETCEGRPGGPLVLESGTDDRSFTLEPAPKESCK